MTYKGIRQREYMREYLRDRRARRREAGQCYLCGQELVDGTSRICQSCQEKNQQRGLRYRQALRQQVIEHYGSQCVCCSENELRFLTIDHINKDGGKRRKDGEPKAGSLYRWIVDMGFPDDLQLLCWNCNCSKGLYGQCPHENAERTGV